MVRAGNTRSGAITPLACCPCVPQSTRKGGRVGGAARDVQRRRPGRSHRPFETAIGGSPSRRDLAPSTTPPVELRPTAARPKDGPTAVTPGRPDFGFARLTAATLAASRRA